MHGKVDIEGLETLIREFRVGEMEAERQGVALSPDQGGLDFWSMRKNAERQRDELEQELRECNRHLRSSPDVSC